MDAPAPAPPRAGVRAVALAYGVACHALFAAAIVAMFWEMRHGMTRSLGRVGPPASAAWAANAALLLQFPLVHSLLLTDPGRRVLARLAPRALGTTLATTTYAAVASLQTLALFLLWTPSGEVWWRAQGGVLAAITVANLGAWCLLGRAIRDAGLALQTGFLGWGAAWRGRPARFPPMPERGLFALCRQPIYVAFAATTWTVPTWTPDQAVVSGVLTLYCLLGPRIKERRFRRLFGARFDAYRARVPYWLPRP